MLTEPDEAVRFVRDTGVDALAIAIGTSHGAYKFSQRPLGDVALIRGRNLLFASVQWSRVGEPPAAETTAEPRQSLRR